MSTFGLGAAGGFIDEKQVGMHYLGERNGRSLADIQIVGDRRYGVRCHRAHIDPWRRLRDPLSYDAWSAGGGELAGDGIWHQDLAVETPEKIDVFQQDQVV
ncbi:MAG TPA: hypothetical protein VMO26_27670 [Vicinamibacterales bacterium]|nr:hypothetical protein [Vicinamibacterales bacterium]